MLADQQEGGSGPLLCGDLQHVLELESGRPEGNDEGRQEGGVRTVDLVNLFGCCWSAAAG